MDTELSRRRKRNSSLNSVNSSVKYYDGIGLFDKHAENSMHSIKEMLDLRSNDQNLKNAIQVNKQLFNLSS